MATYAVGDIQGCFTSLMRVLEAVSFDQKNDELWCVGDLVNRGEKSLETLRFIKNLGDSAKVVLGNHDLHLLAIAAGCRKANKKDTLEPILNASDRTDLLDWLRHQPLIYSDQNVGYTMVHAGIPPMWSIKKSIKRASEVEEVIRSDKSHEFFSEMYGDKPDIWDSDLSGVKRLRLITNYFTRMRFCTKNGRLELNTKTGLRQPAPKGFAPWFSFDNPKITTKVLFGHWAALEGVTLTDKFIALDTGCVWGGYLTLLCLNDGFRYSVKCA